MQNLLSPRRLPAVFGSYLVLCALTSSLWAAPAPTQTLLDVTQAALSIGQVETLTASVSAGGAAVTGGTVTFLDGASALGTVQLVRTASGGFTTGTATLKTMGLAAGSHSVMARYDGDATDAASTSAAQTVTVTGAYGTWATLASSGEAGQTTLTATVAGTGPAPLSGTVAFMDTTAGLTLNTATVNPATQQTVVVRSGSAATGAGPVALAIADLNGDGIPDVVTANQFDDTVSVLLGDGHGGFAAKVSLTVPPILAGYPYPLDPAAVAVWDFNGDGWPDLAVLTSNGIVMYLGDGTGAFTESWNYYLSSSRGPLGLVVGDFNEDGNADMVSANGETVQMLLGDGTGRFATPDTVLYGDFQSPSFNQLAMADLNHDGHRDAVMLSTWKGRLEFSLNDGSGHFTLQPMISVGKSPSALVAGDFNGDGQTDLAIADQTTNFVQVWIGHGDGTFTAATSVAVGQAPVALAAADFDGDGTVDLAVANQGDNTVTLLHGDGAGGFSAMGTFGVDLSPIALGVADVNGDGRPDLLVATERGNSIDILLNETRALAMLATVTIPGSGIDEVTAAYQGDAVHAASAGSNAVGVSAALVSTALALGLQPATDVVSGEFVRLTATVSPNTESGVAATGTVTFRDGTNGMGTAPLGANGTASLLTANLASGAHSFTAAYNGDHFFAASLTAASVNLQVGTVTVSTPAATTTALTADVSSIALGTPVAFTAAVAASGAAVTDGTVSFFDGKMLLGTAPVVANAAAGRTVGTATWRTNGLALGSHTVTAHYNGDRVHAASDAGSQTVTVSGQNASLIARASAIARTGPEAGQEEIDATVEAFGLAAPTGTVQWVDETASHSVLGTQTLLAQDFLPGFFDLAQLAVGNGPVAVEAADFNGDGFPDFVVVNRYSNTLSILLGDGKGSLHLHASPPVGNGPVAVAVADFDGDGVSDLAVVNGADSTVSLLRGDGSGGFTPFAVIPVGQAPTALAVGDVNGDGSADLAVTSRGENTVTVLLGDGTGGFALASTTATGRNPEGVAIADFTRDGQADLAVANSDDNTVSLLAGDGAGNFTLNSTYKTDLSPGGLASGDVNFDGIPDLAVACAGGATLDVLLGTGKGGFQFKPGSGAGVFLPGTPPGQVVIADLNGDGNPDVAMSNYAGDYPFLAFAGDGTGNFTEMGGPGPTLTWNDFTGLAAADVNGDGRGDVVAVNELNDAAIVYAGYLGNPLSNTMTVPGSATHSVVLVYAGDVTYTAAQSDAVSVIATPIPTKIELEPALAVGITPGQTITLSASIAPFLVNGMTAGGTVNFSEDGAAIGTAAVKADGTASLITAELPAGPHSFTASYSGDANFVASQTATATVVWAQAPSFVQLAASQGTLTVGGMETLTATLTTNNQAIAGGTVQFLDGGAVLAAAPVTVGGSAVLKTAALAAGSHSITAQYTGGNGTAAGLSNAVTVTVSGQYPAAVSLEERGWVGDYTLQATVSGAGPAPTGTVTFTDMTTQKAIGRAPLAGSASLAMAPAASIPLPAVGSHLAAGDFNGDGDPDLAIATVKTNEVEIWLNQGDGSLAQSGVVSLPGGCLSMAVGDFNGDGKADLAVGVSGNPSLLIYLGDGTGGFTLASSLSGTSAGEIVIADFNGDGHADLAVSDSMGSSGQILLGDGAGHFTEVARAGGAPGYGGVAVADFNGDDKPDLAYSNYFNQTVDIYLGDGDGHFTRQSSPAAGKGPVWIVTGDFNGDSNADLAVGDTDDHTVTVLWGDGTGKFTAGPVLNASSSVTGLVSGDFNGDGHPDLAATSQYSDTMNVFLGDGKGEFMPVAVNLDMALNGKLVSANLNPDGLMDLAMLDGNGNLQMLFASNAVSTKLENVAIPGSGAHTVTASYGGDGNYTPSQPSNTVALTASAVVTTVALAASVNPVAYGNSEVLTVTVAGKTGAPAPTGSVTLYDDQTQQVAALTLDANGSAAWTMKVQSMKTHSYTARYSGDGNYAPSQTAATLVVTVNDGPAAVALSASTPALTFGQPETLTAQVSSQADGGTPTGSVTFLDGATPLGTGTLDGHGTAVVSVPTLGGGSHSLTAQYSGDAAYAAAHSAAAVVAVQPAPVTLTVTPSKTTGAYGDAVTLSAKVSSAAGTPTGTVTFVQDGVTLGSADLDAQGAAALSTTKLPGGTDHITANYGGSSNFATAASEAVTVQLTPAADYQISSDTATLTVKVGGTAAAKLTLTPVNGFDQTVGLSCGTLPAGVSCGFSPASLSLAAGSGTMKLTVSVAASAAAAPTPFSGGAVPPARLGWVLLFLLGGLLGVAGQGRMRRLAGVGLMAAALAGCGGAPASSGSTPAPPSITGTHAVTITATTATAGGSGGTAITHTVPITIVVQ